MARYFRLPFADSGDKDPLPDETVNSIVSYATGYSQDYQRNPASDPLARRMERNFFNQLLFDVTDTLKELYEIGTVPFITSAMNNGSAFSYGIGARVILSNRIYENTTANNTTTPPAAGWVLVDVSGGDARYLLEANNLSDLTNATTARTNLSVYSRAETFTRTEQDARFLLESNNLDDLTNITTARTNLDVYSRSESNSRYLSSLITHNGTSNVSTNNSSGVLTLTTGPTGFISVDFHFGGRSQYNSGGTVSLTVTINETNRTRTITSSVMEYDARRSGVVLSVSLSESNRPPNSSITLAWSVTGRIESRNFTYDYVGL